MKSTFTSITNYYIHNFLTIRNKFPRSFFLSCFLIPIQSLQLFSMILNERILDEFHQDTQTFLPVLRWILRAVRIYPVFQQSEQDSMIIFINLWLGIFFSSIVILFINFYLTSKYQMLEQKSKESQILLEISLESLNINEQFSKSTAFFINIFEYILSFIMQTYFYLFFQTLTYCCFYTINQQIFQSGQNNLWTIEGSISAVIVVLISIMLTIFMSFHNFDFRFNTNDYLGRKVNIWQNIVLMVKYITIFISAFDLDNETSLWAGIIYLVLTLVLGHNYQLYQQFSVMKIKLMLDGQMFTLSIICSILVWSDLFDDTINSVYFLSFPIVFQIQLSLIKYVESQLHLFDHDNIKFLENKLRMLYHLSRISFIKTGKILNKTQAKCFQTVQLHSFAANHLRLCQFNTQRKYIQGKSHQKQCFCFDYFPNQLEAQQKSWKQYTSEEEYQIKQNSVDSFQDEKQFKRFIYELIKLHFEQYFDAHPQDSTSQMWFSYIYFIFQVVKQPTKAFYEALNLKNKPQFRSIKNSMIIESLVKDAKENFDKMIIKKNLKNQKYNLQVVFEFDQSIDIAKQNFIKTLQLYKRWFGLMITEHLNLDQISSKGNELLLAIKNLQTQMKTLYYTNPLSTECDTLCYLYYKYLNMNIKRPKELKRDSLRASSFLNSIQRDIFNKESCVIYITLMQPRGTIRKYTKGFKKLSGYSDQEVMNQNIRGFMPEILSIHHDMYLENFIEKGRMNIVMAEHRFLLLKKKDRFVIPVIAKIRLENYSTLDFGASALVTRINLQMYYLVINKFGLLEELSENFYKEVLQKNVKVDQKQIKGIDCLKLIPQLIQLWKSYTDEDLEKEEDESDQGMINIEQQLEGYIVVPRNQYQIEKLFQNRKNSNVYKYKKYMMMQDSMNKDYYSRLEDVAIFSIKFKVIEMKTINMNLKIIEIQSLRSLKQQQRDKILYSLKLSNRQNGPNDVIEIKRFNNYEQPSLNFNSIRYNNSQPSEIILFGNKTNNNCDLEENLILEEDSMARMKSLNLQDKSQFNQTNEQLFPDTLPISTLHRDDYDKFLLDPRANAKHNSSSDFRNSNSGITPQGVRNLQGQQKNFESFDSDDDSLDNNSSSKNKVKEGIIHNDASSVASSQAYEDSRTKKRLIKDVLLQNVENNQQGAQSNILSKLSIVTLICFYCIHFAQIVNKNLIFQQLSQASRIPYKLKSSMDSYIIASNQADQELMKFSYLMNQSSLDYKGQILQLINLKLNSYALQQNSLVNIYLNGNNQSYQGLNQFYAFGTLAEQIVSIDKNSTRQFIDMNYIQYQKAFEQLNQTFFQFFNDQIDSSNLVNIVIFTLSEILIAFLILSIFPIYIFIQKKRALILELFSTFQNGQLQYQYQLYNKLITQCEEQKFVTQEANEDGFEQSNIRQIAKTLKPQKDISLSKLKQNKIKNIFQSNTPFLLFLIFLIITFFMILSAYLIASFVIQKQFIENFQIYDDQVQIFDTINNFLSNQTTFKQILLYHNIDNPYYSEYKPAIEKIVITEINLYKYYLQSITNFHASKQIITQIINDDTCRIFDSDFLNQLTDNEVQIFSQTNCVKVQEQKQGIELSLIQQNTLNLEFYQSLNSLSNITEIYSYLKEQQNIDSNLLKLLYNQFALNTISDHLHSVLQLYIQNNLEIQIIIFSFGISFITVFFYFCEKYFGEILMNQIQKTKQLLTLLPFELLLENAYVMTFIVQESKKINI